MPELLTQILIMLGIAVIVVVSCQRMRVPTSLAYLLVGLIIGPYTIGPDINVPGLQALAEFGVVFLLFTIGLNYSLPQLHALRHQILGLGTAQVVLTAAVVALILWLAGLAFAVAFVIGAVFAQSSSTIIGSQLTEQGEENQPHGRLGLAMSVFQDVTAVPFLIIIPVLGAGVATDLLALELGWALIKAVIAFALVFYVSRWLLRPLFYLIAKRRSVEVFTLTVLLVALAAAWATDLLGLSLAFGAFLAGMMLGETEFRHQVESSIRPFRDVLLGLFFIGIGMLFNPGVLPQIWHLAILGALLILLSKFVLVAAMIYKSGIEALPAIRTALLLAVGGEFGFALLAIALDNDVISTHIGQIALTSVLLSMLIGSFLIRYNHAIAKFIAGKTKVTAQQPESHFAGLGGQQVIIGGYGRMGHAIAVLLQNLGIPFLAFETNLQRVEKGRSEGHQVMYGDISDPELLAAIHIERASMVVITVDHPGTALRTASLLRSICPQVAVIARARDLESSRRLRQAGADHAYPETIEASLMLGEAALRILGIAQEDIAETIQNVRDWGYGPVLDEAEQPKAKAGKDSKQAP